MREYLFNKAYEFFPKQLNGLDETYMLTKEIINFRSTAEKSIKKEYSAWVEMIKKMNSEFYKFKILDKTNFTLNYPSLALQGLLNRNENSVITFNFYSSLLIPYYYCSICKYEKESDIFQLKSVIINPIDNIEINKIYNFIKKGIDKELLLEEHLDLIIPKLSFETISDGDFKVMNAFF